MASVTVGLGLWREIVSELEGVAPIGTQCYTARLASVSGMQLIVIDVQCSAEVKYFVRSDLSNIAFIRHGATSARTIQSTTAGDARGRPEY